jgi:uncharacterized cupin superfamily protein
MKRVDVDEVDGVPDSATVKRPLTRALGATNVALNRYELAPGDSFAYGYHRHSSQEEVFVIEQGTVTFETEAGAVEVDAGEAVRFGPGEFQQGVNRGDERVVALAIGAPQDSGDVEIRRHCPTCGERTSTTVESDDDGAATLTRCLECGAETGRFT